MLDQSIRMPQGAWRGILARTILITGAGAVLSVLVVTAVFNTLSNGLSPVGLAVSVLIPILIGGPLTLIHSIRGAQLQLANQQLQILASTDWLTDCLNRRAFTALVHDELETGGAFLVIDADNFKEINDRHGHQRGDEVLKQLAATIKASVRARDVVGRIGGEEFGVFLRGADQIVADLIGERIRSAVEDMVYAPDGEPIPVSVSVGGAIFNGDVSFSTLFKVADKRLYGVKQTGRNRTHIAPVNESATLVQQLAS